MKRILSVFFVTLMHDRRLVTYMPHVVVKPLNCRLHGLDWVLLIYNINNRIWFSNVIRLYFQQHLCKIYTLCKRILGRGRAMYNNRG